MGKKILKIKKREDKFKKECKKNGIMASLFCISKEIFIGTTRSKILFFFLLLILVPLHFFCNFFFNFFLYQFALLLFFVLKKRKEKLYFFFLVVSFFHLPPQPLYGHLEFDSLLFPLPYQYLNVSVHKSSWIPRIIQ